MTCICKNILSVKHILPECPVTTELFQENGYDFNACNNVRDILYNTDIISSGGFFVLFLFFVFLCVHVCVCVFVVVLCLISPQCEQT